VRLLITLLSTVLFVIIFAVSPSMAQDVRMPYRFDVFGSLGGAKYDGTKIHELNFGGGFVVRPFSRKLSPLRGLGFEFEANRTSTDPGAFEPPRKTATGAVLYGYPLKHFEPYVLIGMGASTLGCYGLNLGCDQGIRVGVGGLGVRVFLNERVSLRPEFRAFEAMGSNAYIYGGSGFGKHLYRASIGIGYQFH
jgi:hypothetical protein